MTTAYPLAWPPGWPRTPAHKRATASFQTERGTRGPAPEGAYKARPKPVTVAISRQRLAYQVDALGAALPVLSTNLELRLDGQPRSDRRDPEDPGAACYFQLRGRPIVLACDRWNTVAGNIAAIAAHIDAMRRMDRYGVGSVERMFEGFAALPVPGRVDWRADLGIPPDALVTAEVIQQRWRSLAEKHHPDRGGNPSQMAAVNAARDAALQELRA